MRNNKYPSDVADAQWALIESLIPVYPGGRPRKTPLRDVVDAIFYILCTGCQWRYLPKDFPPKSTVWRYFDQWRHDASPRHLEICLARCVASVLRRTRVDRLYLEGGATAGAVGRVMGWRRFEVIGVLGSGLPLLRV